MLRLGLSIGKVGRRIQGKKMHECFTHRTPLRTEDEGIAVAFDLEQDIHAFELQLLWDTPMVVLGSERRIRTRASVCDTTQAQPRFAEPAGEETGAEDLEDRPRGGAGRWRSALRGELMTKLRVSGRGGHVSASSRSVL